MGIVIKMISKVFTIIYLVAGIFAQIPVEKVTSLPDYGPEGYVFDKFGVYSGW